MKLKLYDYWRSSAAYRLRIALQIKGVAYETVSVNLHPDFGEHKGEAYRNLNPQMRVPAIEIDGKVIGQSMAILEWIEETWPSPSLLPDDPIQRLRTRAFADTIACDVHPLNNLSVLSILRGTFSADTAAIQNWYADWIVRGFTALEAQLADQQTEFAFGDRPTIAEISLVPQMYNARRFSVDLSAFPKLVAIDAACQEIAAFQAASPEAVKPA